MKPASPHPPNFRHLAVTPPREAKFYAPKQAANLLGISTRTLRRAVLASELPVVKYNRRTWRFSAIDLAAWYCTRGGRLKS